MTGFGTAAAYGFPALSQLTMGKMVENVRTLARSVDISVICDADTSYDEAINVQRTVCEYEDRKEAIWPK
jgi:2-methylisocitrate lyase-like PEP mutase family enzyme